MTEKKVTGLKVFKSVLALARPVSYVLVPAGFFYTLGLIAQKPVSGVATGLYFGTIMSAAAVSEIILNEEARMKYKESINTIRTGIKQLKKTR